MAAGHASGDGLRAWLADPGGVAVGTTFHTELHLDGAPRDRTFRCRVEIVFDPRMLYCISLEPPPAEGPPVSHDVTIALGRVEAELTVEAGTHSHVSLAPGRGGDIPVATLRWRCVGEGNTDVSVRLVDPEGQAGTLLRVVQRPRD